jgi:hypothetical protein
MKTLTLFLLISLTTKIFACDVSTTTKVLSYDSKGQDVVAVDEIDEFVDGDYGLAWKLNSYRLRRINLAKAGFENIEIKRVMTPASLAPYYLDIAKTLTEKDLAPQLIKFEAKDSSFNLGSGSNKKINYVITATKKGLQIAGDKKQLFKGLDISGTATESLSVSELYLLNDSKILGVIKGCGFSKVFWFDR